MTRLLIVDDEPQILRALRPGLLAAGYEVEAVGAAQDAIAAIGARSFDVVIVDLGLPDMDGKDLIAHVRQRTEAPIVVLSARDAESEKVAALDLGANDFVNKPFSIGELMARLRVALRPRPSPAALKDPVQLGALEVNFEARRVRIAGRDVKLSPREAKLLRAFAQQPGQVLTHQQIVAAVWGAGEKVEPQFVRVLIGNLRQKVEKDPSRPVVIITEPGVGYRMHSQA